MNFCFREMKPVIQREFDRVFDLYPTDMTDLREMIPVGGDAYERKRAILKIASEMCPVHIFPHYPFAFEMDMGEERHVCYVGIGNECLKRSGIDLTPLREKSRGLSDMNLSLFGSFTDFLHRTLDHDKLLHSGFRGAYEECERLNLTETDPEKKRYRENIMFVCKCVEKIGLRLRARAAEMLENASDEDEKYNLSRILSSANTPWEPAETFFDALNSILSATLFISGLDGVEMNCYGQLDRLLYPYYEKELREGKITYDEAYFLLQCFLHKTDMHCLFNDERKTYDNGVSVMIGGCDPEGNTVYNPITEMIIRAYTENKLINPKLNARVSSESPREYIESLVSLSGTCNNNLVLENDDYIIPMFLRMGLLPEDARTYAGNGCQEVICRNHMHSRAFIYLNLAEVLLDTMKYEASSLPEALRPVYANGLFEKQDFSRFYASFLKNLRSLIIRITDIIRPYEAQLPRMNPEPMYSCFTADCISSGRDNSDMGARYNHKTLSLVGFGTLADSLLSLRRAYSEGRQDALLRAVEENFENDKPLLHALGKSDDRFGHSSEADCFAKELANDLAEISRGIFNARGIEWRTSLFTYYQFKNFGAHTGATPDGRRAGEPLSRQMNMAKLPGLTAAALSMNSLTEADFNDVGMFDFTLPVTVTSGENAKRALTDFIRAAISLKIPVLQPNVADIRALKEERDKKGTHPDLIVRVCGYSAIFGQLPVEAQNEIIHRAEM